MTNESSGPHHALLAAAERAGLPVGDHPPRLLRLGSNATFHLDPPRGDTVGRVSPPDRTDAARTTAQLALDVAGWLAGHGFPAARPLPAGRLAVPQPIDEAGRQVSFWTWIGRPGEPERHGTPLDLGHLLRDFHALPPPIGAPPPPFDPVARATAQLTACIAAGRLDRDDADVLADRLAEVGDAYATVAWALPTGVLHGDATTANVVLDAAGRPTLLDFDLARTGPREWDLVRLATYHHRLGWHDAAEYAAFCAGYGWDVARWSGFDTLADLAELMQVAWLANAAAHRADLRPELALRVRTVRTGGSRRTWRAI